MGLMSFLRSLFGARPPSPPLPLPARPVAARGQTVPPAAAAPKPNAAPAGLDAGPFAPISRAELLAGRGGLFNPWFGRQDRIPPLSDPRTLTIDRALVTMGFLTGDQLREIHAVGDRMNELRPPDARALVEESLRADRAEREALKARKKAEAAARREERARQVAHRRATDIVFLGRGVSHGLSDRRCNVEKLAALGLPVLASPADVAAALGVDIPRLRWLCFHNEAATVSHYRRFDVPKRSGGTRTLSAPMPRLAACQRWILRNILDRVPVHAAAHGFVRGRSIHSNARPHAGHPLVVNLDLRDFFPTIGFPRVRGLFRGLGYSPSAATVLALLCTESPRVPATVDGKALLLATGPRALPQGACTSPALSNLASRRMDFRLDGLARKLGWVYTRYADDLTFSSASGEAAAQVGWLMAKVRHIADGEGFTVNEDKTRVQRPNRRQTVTGLVVNREPAAPRALRRRLRAILHQAGKAGLDAQNREGRENYADWLRGNIAFVHAANPRHAKPLAEAFARLP